jgi:hypothetical protein
VPLGEWAATGNNIALGVIANGFELPHALDELEVAYMITLGI